MTKHTPGPWAVLQEDEWSCLKGNDKPSTICHVGDWAIVTDDPSYEFHGEDWHDALLVAAAPTLLDALTLARLALNKATDGDAYSEFMDTFKVIDAAIARAAGDGP